MNEVRNKWDSPTAIAAWVVLVVNTTITCWVNARYAVMTGSHVGFHAAIPVAVLVTAVFAEMAALSSAHRWVKWACVTVLVGIFGTVLVASYLGVLHVFLEWNPNPDETARKVYHVVAAIPDALMVVSGTVLMSLRMKRKKSVVKDAETAKPSRWKRIADAAANRAEAALAVPETPQVERVVEVRGGVVERFDPPTDRFMKPVVEPSVKPAAEVTEDSAETFVEAETAPVETPAKPEPAAKKPATKPAMKAVDPELEPFMDAAQRMVDEEVVTRKTAVELAQVIAAIERRESPNRIKTTLGISPTTTKKVADAWREIELEPEREPELVSAAS